MWIESGRTATRVDKIEAELVRAVLNLELAQQHPHNLCRRHTAVDADVGHRAERWRKHRCLFETIKCERKWARI